MLPKGWSHSSLDKVSKVIDCKHRTPLYVENGIPLVSPGTIKWGAIDLESPNKRVTYEEYESLMNHCNVQIGDLVMSRNQTVGVASYINTASPFVLGQDTVLIKPVKAEPTYLFYSLQSSDIQRKIFRLSGGSTFSRINLADIRKLQIYLPTLPEQKKIAQTLSIWDKAIEKLEALIAAKQKRKKALMQQLLTGKKRFAGFEGEWETQPLAKICKIIKGEQLNRDTLSEIGSYPVINGGITPSGYGEDFNRGPNTITISEGGNSCGFVNLIRTRFWCGGHCYALDNVKPVNEYLYQSLKLNEHKIMRLRVGSGLPNIQKKDIEHFHLDIPRLKEEQQKIAAVLTAADREIETHQKQLKALKEQKKGLMQQLLTGKKRVKIDEPVQRVAVGA